MGGKLFEKMRIWGRVTVRVLDETGKVKRRKPGFIRRLLKIQGKKMESTNHNIITSQGDALLADWLSATIPKTVIDAVNGHMEAGTGWTGNSPKSNTGCNTPTGARKVMDAGYPQPKGGFGAADDNVAVYRATLTAGNLDANGINEAALMNHLTAGECLAYAQLIPEANVTVNDTLQIEWEITFLGS